MPDDKKDETVGEASDADTSKLGGPGPTAADERAADQTPAPPPPDEPSSPADQSEADVHLGEGDQKKELDRRFGRPIGDKDTIAEAGGSADPPAADPESAASKEAEAKALDRAKSAELAEGTETGTD